jgi:hypothetical protein
MKNIITIPESELQQQIDLRNFYMGESAKRKDKDADTIQSSKEDKDLLQMFMHTACNEMVTAVALRFPSISYTIEEGSIVFEFETEGSVASHLLPMLQRAILDCIVNEVIMQWLLLRRPDMAHTYISLRSSLAGNVMFTFAKIYNSKKIRRRATDLGGI